MGLTLALRFGVSTGFGASTVGVLAAGFAFGLGCIAANHVAMRCGIVGPAARAGFFAGAGAGARVGVGVAVAASVVSARLRRAGLAGAVSVDDFARGLRGAFAAIAAITASALSCAGGASATTIDAIASLRASGGSGAG